MVDGRFGQRKSITKFSSPSKISGERFSPSARNASRIDSLDDRKNFQHEDFE